MDDSRRWRAILIHESATKSHWFELDAIGRLQKPLPRQPARNLTVLLHNLIGAPPDHSPPIAPTADNALLSIGPAVQPTQLPFPRHRLSPQEEANIDSWTHAAIGDDT
jgi:hypothetical protein